MTLWLTRGCGSECLAGADSGQPSLQCSGCCCVLVLPLLSHSGDTVIKILNFALGQHQRKVPVKKDAPLNGLH